MAAIILYETKSPAEQVFAIPELLEKIMLNMPIREVLHAQRISKDCEANIKISSKLQQALFFKPFPLQVMKPPKHMSPTTASTYEQMIRDPQNRRFKGLLSRMHANMPIVNDPFTDYITYDYYPFITTMLSWHPGMIPENSWRETARRRPEASWRRMYLTQPATKLLESSKKCGDLGNDLVNVQRYLSRNRHEIVGFLRVDYADDMHDILRGRIELSEIEIDEDRSDARDMLKAENLTGVLESAGSKAGSKKSCKKKVAGTKKKPIVLD